MGSCDQPSLDEAQGINGPACNATHMRSPVYDRLAKWSMAATRMDNASGLSVRHLTNPDYGRLKGGQHEPLQKMTRPHVDSFNWMLTEGLNKSMQHLIPQQFALPNGQRIAIYIKEANITPPTVSTRDVNARTLKVFPAECRESGTTYRGQLRVSVMWKIDGVDHGPHEAIAGEVPIMVKSAACNIVSMKPRELTQHGEEAEEMGGYFIVNGNEKIIRMLVMPRRNFPTAITRSSWKNRGKAYTEFGVTMRCVTADQTSTTNVLHYLNNGTANLSFTHRKEQFFVPVVMILKALVNMNDQFIYNELICGREDNSFYKGCVANMLRLAQEEGLNKQKVILKYIGERFRVKVQVPEWYTDEQVANFLIEQCICIHLNSNRDKFNILVYMTQKLFAYAKDECATESADNPMFQEALLGGHLYVMVLKEKLENWLYSTRLNIDRMAKQKDMTFTVTPAVLNDAVTRATQVTQAMEYLLATGNLISKTGLGLMQATGLVVIADKLNFFRYLSHFRCIHRGAFFAEMRTTTVRKLLPEAWGFMCPVHTPDGTPCGLLNHLSSLCELVNVTYPNKHLPKLLIELGMHPYGSSLPYSIKECYTVMLDGAVIGWLHDSSAKSVAEQLRLMKVTGQRNVPKMMEICYVAKTEVASQYPGLYLFTTVARFARQVKNLACNEIEMIGSFEQVYLNIAIIPEEAHPGMTTHMELREDAMLSVIAQLTPYSDYNQSPRNMYQCQMGKQTMGTPLHAYQHRCDNKLYRIQTPQGPLVKPQLYDHYGMDEYPLGTNAVVAVISYTGYDMEDAMILNKASFERGFAHGTVYKSQIIDLREHSGERGKIPLMFGRKPDDVRLNGKLDLDGLPPIGAYLTEGDPFFSYINTQTGETKVERYKGQENAYVDSVKIISVGAGDALIRAAVTLRVTRNPIIGDKFASRHGQKGICSQKWPVENMPFSESGMTPDIIFNPHGFPSRMTIGMMIESMAGKSGAMHGLCHDATPFQFSEETPPIDYFGQLLEKAGYNYYGTERMYSGINGEEFEADIFMGVVYYQRLRHMVSDKFQVRTTGPIDILTHQPVKGRKRMGGIRFGEMERDALLAHGSSFLLEDRLLNCSDKCVAHVCDKCGSLLSPMIEKPESSSAAASFEATRKWQCKVCQSADSVKRISVPYVFRYLVAELAAMNIKVELDVREREQ